MTAESFVTDFFAKKTRDFFSHIAQSVEEVLRRCASTMSAAISGTTLAELDKDLSKFAETDGYDLSTLRLQEVSAHDEPVQVLLDVDGARRTELAVLKDILCLFPMNESVNE